MKKFESIRDESRWLFSVVTEQDPDQLYHDGGTIPQIRNASVEYASRRTNYDFSESAVDLLQDGLTDTLDAVQTVFVNSQLVAPIEHRLSIVRDPRTISALAAAAARAAEIKDIAIHHTPQSPPNIQLSRDNTHIIAVGLREVSPASRRCPYAGNGSLEPIAPIFRRFVPWAGHLAVLLDNPSYIKRTGQN